MGAEILKTYENEIETVNESGISDRGVWCRDTALTDKEGRTVAATERVHGAAELEIVRASAMRLIA
jgi:endonuclease YncB( thermonuclease family)